MFFFLLVAAMAVFDNDHTPATNVKYYAQHTSTKIEMKTLWLSGNIATT